MKGDVVCSHQQLKRAYDVARGRTMLAMIFFWSIFCYMAIRSGRELRDAGYSLTKEGLTQLDRLREQGRQEREAAAAAAKKSEA